VLEHLPVENGYGRITSTAAVRGGEPLRGSPPLCSTVVQESMLAAKNPGIL
jgi:hypothetical protein